MPCGKFARSEDREYFQRMVRKYSNRKNIRNPRAVAHIVTLNHIRKRKKRGKK